MTLVWQFVAPCSRKPVGATIGRPHSRSTMRRCAVQTDAICKANGVLPLQDRRTIRLHPAQAGGVPPPAIYDTLRAFLVREEHKLVEGTAAKPPIDSQACGLVQNAFSHTVCPLNGANKAVSHNKERHFAGFAPSLHQPKGKAQGDCPGPSLWSWWRGRRRSRLLTPKPAAWCKMLFLIPYAH